MNLRNVSFAILLLISWDATYADQKAVRGVKNILVEKDAFLTFATAAQSNATAQYFMSFVMTTTDPVDPAQGTIINRCDVYFNQSACVLKIKCTHDHPPLFQPISTARYQPTDYDPEGNLIVWEETGKYMIFTKNRNDVRDERIVYRITPQGKILSTNIYTKYFRYPVGSHDSIYLLDQLQLAVGRGFGHFLSEPADHQEPDVSSNGLATVYLHGNYGPTLSGTWSLTYDAATDYLVRSASFTRANRSKPVVIVSNSGIVQAANIEIAATGSFSTGSYQADFQILSLKPIDSYQSNQEIIRKEIDAPLPKGNSSTLDERDAH